MGFTHKCCHQHAVTEQVDTPRNPPRVVVDQSQGTSRPDYRMCSTGDAHTMGEVLLGLGARQFMNMEAHGNTLFELTHLERREFRMQLWLPHENNLEQLAALRFQI